MLDERAFCPHCRRLLLEAAPHPYPDRPVHCGGCRLLVGPGRSLDAHGRLRRVASASASVAPAPDAVLHVLQDLHDGTRDAQLGGAAGALLER